MDAEERREEFKRKLLEVTAHVKPLEEKDIPYVFYNRYGDSLEAVTDIEHVKHNFVAKWVNHTVTLRHGRKTGRVVGFELCSLSNMSERLMEWALNFLAKNGVELTPELAGKIEETRKGAAGTAAYEGDNPEREE